MDEYIKLHGKRLYGLCRKLCKNIADADDLYQEMWIKVLENFDSYDKTKSFESWAAKICVNLYRNFLRRLKISPIFDNFVTNEEKETAINSQTEILPDYNDLYETVNNLPEKLRTTIILFYFRDMDIAETARVLSIPEGTVKSRLSNAKKRMKEVLGDE